MKIGMQDIVMMILGAVAGFMIAYLGTSSIWVGCVGIISGVGGGALGSYVVRKITSKKSN